MFSSSTKHGKRKFHVVVGQNTSKGDTKNWMHVHGCFLLLFKAKKLPYNMWACLILKFLCTHLSWKALLSCNFSALKKTLLTLVSENKDWKREKETIIFSYYRVNFPWFKKDVGNDLHVCRMGYTSVFYSNLYPLSDPILWLFWTVFLIFLHI